MVDTVLHRKGVVAITMEVLVHIGRFPIHRAQQIVTESWKNKGVQEGNDAVTVGNLCGEFNMWVSVINMLKESLTMPSLLDDLKSHPHT